MMLQLAARRLVTKAPPHLFALRASFATVGDHLPSVELHSGFPQRKSTFSTTARAKTLFFWAYQVLLRPPEAQVLVGLSGGTVTQLSLLLANP